MEKRIQKIMAEHGIASRRAAEKLITEGRVLVNGKPATLGQSADDETAKITVDGQALRRRPPSVYLMLNKPRGVVTSLADEQGRRDLNALLGDIKQRVVPVGRLDRNSEGLLLLTNDGALVQRLTHPSHAVDKRYRVSVRGALKDKVDKLRESIDIDGKMTIPAQVSIVREEEDGSGGTLDIVLREGRKRQIRHLCEHAELTVSRLSRRAIGELRLGALAVGEYRFLTDDEVKYLKSL